MSQILLANIYDYYNNMPQLTIGERIKFLMDSHKVSIRKFAQMLDVSDTNIRNYIDKGTKPSSDVLEKIVQIIPLTNTSWLLTGEGEPFLTPPTENILSHANPRKISHSQIIGRVGGSATQNTGVQADVVVQLENTKLLLIEAKRYSEQLERQLADKERMIQLLLNQQPKP